MALRMSFPIVRLRYRTAVRHHFAVAKRGFTIGTCPAHGDASPGLAPARTEQETYASRLLITAMRGTLT